MPINDPNLVYDGFSHLVAGVDDGRNANLLDKDQCVSAENAIFRGADTTTRPPFRTQTLTFQNPNLTYDQDGLFSADPGPTAQGYVSFFEKKFQEVSYYSPKKEHEFLMASIGGRLYQITPGKNDQMSVYEIALTPGRNREDIPIAYHLQAGKYHIVQDGESSPVITDLFGARRSKIDEIFVGKMMGYGQGRIVLIGTDNQIYFGDLRDSDGNGDDDLLKFTETSFLNEGFPSALPSGMGDPTAIQFIPQQDSATGVGECLVFGDNGVESFYLSLPRETWKDSQFQHTALLGIGNGGHRSVCSVNEDIWFRAKDGYRSYRQARAQINQWAQIPMSSNISTWMNADTPDLLEFASVISFDKRLIGTVTPYPNKGRLYHNGLVSLDFDILSTFGRLANPSWDGHWSNRTADPLVGLRVLQLVQGIFAGEHRAFAFVLLPNGHNSIIEISKQLVGHDNTGRITSRIVTRSMDFQQEYNEKNLYGGDLWFTNVREDTDVSVRYRPDQYPDFSPWHTFSISPFGQAKEGDALVMKDGFVPRRSLPKPSDAADATATKRNLRRGYEFQAEIEWSGRSTISKFRASAQQELEDSKAKV